MPHLCYIDLMPLHVKVAGEFAGARGSEFLHDAKTEKPVVCTNCAGSPGVLGHGGHSVVKRHVSCCQRQNKMHIQSARFAQPEEGHGSAAEIRESLHRCTCP